MPLSSYLIFIFYKLLYLTWRVRIFEDPQVQSELKTRHPLILAHWHGDELAVLHLVTRYRLATMTSTSKDGSAMDGVVKLLGGQTSRGSSTRGGVGALIGLVKLLRAGNITSIAVDGPRGPIHQPKPGVFELSKLGGASIVPVGVVASRAWISEKSWNKIFLPLPFSTVSIVLSEPIPAIGREQEPKDVALARMLTTRLFAAKQQASKIIAVNS